MPQAPVALHASRSGKPASTRALLLIEQFRTALQDELQSRTPRQRQETICVPLTDGQRQHVTGRTHYYLFQSEPIPANLVEDTNPSLVLISQRIPCRIVGFSPDGLALAFEGEAPETIPSAHLTFDSVRLLQALDKRLQSISQQPDTFGTALALKAFDPDAIATITALDRLPEASGLNPEQAQAYTNALERDLLFVLGPPGTGKTAFITALSQALLAQNGRTLICSPTNTAIDNILEHLLSQSPDLAIDQVIRIGTPSPDSSDQCQMANLETVALTHTLPLEERAKTLRRQLKDLDRDLPYLAHSADSAKRLDTHWRELQTLRERHQMLHSDERRLRGLITERAMTIQELEGELRAFNASPAFRRLFEHGNKARIVNDLACFRDYQAADEITLRSLQSQVLHSQVRIDTLNRVMEQFRQDHQLPDAPWSPEQLCALHEAMQGIRHDLQGTLDRLENEIAQIEQALVRRSRIVATTLTRTYTSRLLDDQRFDTVIIDEASMALAPALFCTLALATSKVIIVGDFLQLAPIASAKTQATKHWLARSIYDIAQITSGRDPRVVPLSMQYRMHPDIANVSRRLYARAGLSYVSAPSTLTDRSQTAEAAPAPGHSLIFCNTEPAHPVTVRDAKGSPFNLYHALLAVRLAQQALSTPGHLPTVSIICPYRAQVNLIERLLRLEELDELVRVGTIHRFQGRESDVVIFDTVTTENATRSMLGWAYDDAAPHKLINVALTRAKGKLIVIGHHGALATLQHGPQPILWECIEEANANGLHLDATTILQAMTFSLHDSPIESDAVLSRVLARTTASRGQLKPVPSRLISLVQAS